MLSSNFSISGTNENDWKVYSKLTGINLENHTEYKKHSNAIYSPDSKRVTELINYNRYEVIY